jgi:plastocyanin
MARSTIFVLLAAGLLAGPPASAASVSVEITGTDGHPVAGAVVELTSMSGSASPSAKISADAVVDQRNETFFPLVTLIRRGGHVTFTNNDTTMHQVYSFSEIRQFAFEIDRGERSEPVVFDRAGVAAIGCNIHDQMITYVYVAAAPWAGITDADGKLLLGDVPQGAYRANVWHPREVPGQPPAAIPLTVSGDSARLTASIPLLAGDPRGKKHMHMQMY